MNNLSKEYFDFLSDVTSNTMKIIDNASDKDYVNVSWTIVGVDFRSNKVKEMYGEEVYNQANREVPGTKVNGSRILRRDFSGAYRKLGHLIHEGISASKILDLELLVDGLKAKDIPSYIDYENNIFHYNTKQVELKK